uniref:Uncharacterized protein n=1 Tax=Sphaerodactylus townsendi TaxID=933632 RepID=A0ACB8FM01_9SAUR
MFPLVHLSLPPSPSPKCPLRTKLHENTMKRNRLSLGLGNYKWVAFQIFQGKGGECLINSLFFAAFSQVFLTVIPCNLFTNNPPHTHRGGIQQVPTGSQE